MDFLECYNKNQVILMEGAVGERLKAEYSIYPEKYVALAGHIYDENARQAMKNIYGQYINIGIKYGYPMLLTTPTRRANRYNIGRSEFRETVIKDNVEFLKELKAEAPENILIGRLMGCKGDAYKAAGSLGAEEAYEFHSWQAELFRQTQVDYLFAGIMPALPEAVGMARAMETAGLPYIISFMIRDNGRLIDGNSISEAIVTIDEAVRHKPVCYMTNCVHPDILRKALSHSFNRTRAVRERFAGIQANASPMSPEELESGCEILVSDYGELADGMVNLHKEYNLKILGGCCGTDHIYMEEIAKRLGYL